MKLTKLLTLTLAALTLTAFAMGCDGSVTEVTTSTDQPAASTTAGTQRTRRTTATTKLEDNTIIDYGIVSGIKLPWEYVADPSAKAAEEGWILLNDYLEWDEMEVSVVEDSEGDYADITGKFVYSENGDTILEIYAIETVFANHQFDHYSNLRFSSQKDEPTFGGIHPVDQTVISDFWAPHCQYLTEFVTHSMELYTDADLQTPVNRYYFELQSAMEMLAFQECEFEYRILPVVNDLVEIRIWGKIVEN